MRRARIRTESAPSKESQLTTAHRLSAPHKKKSERAGADARVRSLVRPEPHLRTCLEGRRTPPTKSERAHNSTADTPSRHSPLRSNSGPRRLYLDCLRRCRQRHRCSSCGAGSWPLEASIAFQPTFSRATPFAPQLREAPPPPVDCVFRGTGTGTGAGSEPKPCARAPVLRVSVRVARISLP